MAASMDLRNSEILDWKLLISNVKDKTSPCEHADSVDEYLSNTRIDVEIDNEKRNAERWMKWAKQDPNLKIVTVPVPFGILPNGITGVLHDVKVFTKYGPDDPIFDNHKEIRDRVARGNCFLEIDKGDDRGIQCVVYALKKFTGGLGDDDDRDKGDNFTWKKYFTKPLNATSKIICTKKANGEAAHLSCCVVAGKMIFCGGSKNVHLLFNKKDDIRRYTGDRFRIASEICETVCDMLDLMSQEEKHRLMSFLAHTRLTTVFEILSPNHHHVEDLSYLKSPSLKYITWTSAELDFDQSSQLCTMPPHVGIEIAKALGLDPVTYEVIPLCKLEERIAQIRQGYNYEGEVFYFLDKENTVFGLLKKKTIWYIVCRAIREKVKAATRMSVKKPDNFSISRYTRKIRDRMKEIQTWLNLDDESVTEWTELGAGLLGWSIQHISNGKLKISEIEDKYPVVMKRFLHETGKSDKISSNWKEPDGSDE